MNRSAARAGASRQLAAAALAAGLWATLAPAAVRAEDRADIDRTEIIGNRELPRVLYIVPWKKAAPNDNPARPFPSALDEELTPLEPEVFRRQVDYHAQLQAQSPVSPGAAGPAAPAH